MVGDKNTKGNPYWLYPFTSRDCTMIVRRPNDSASSPRFVPTSRARDATEPIGLPRSSTRFGCDRPGRSRRKVAPLESLP